MATLFEHEPRPSKPMREHQEKFFADSREAIREGHTRIIGCASVGWGKTLLSANVFKSSYRKGNMSMFFVPRNALIEPSVEEFEGEGLTDIGIIQQDHPRTNPYAKLQVASIHTYINRQMNPPPRLVIVDEVHLSTKEFQKILDSEEWKNTVVIGLSATPWKKGMGRKWTKLIQTKTTSQLIEAGYLVPARYMVGVEEPSTDGLKTRLDEDGNRVLSEKDEAAVMGDKRIIGDVVKTYLEHGEGRRGFYYAVNLAEAQKIRDAFCEAGVPCGYVDGTMSREKRQKALSMYRRGEFHLVVNYGVLTTGIDEDVRIIGICRIIKSEEDWVQIIGRGLRNDNPYKRVQGMAPKTDLLVIDHGGNLTREDGTALAPAEDIYHDHLDTSDPDDRKVKAFENDAKPPTHKKCKKCGLLISPGERKCGFCFTEVPRTELNHVEGSFVEFSKVKATMQEKQQFFAQLKWIAHQKGKSEGWAAHTYRAKFGVWPNNFRDTPAMPPSAEVSKYVRHRAIAWAKGREKAQA